MNCKQSQRLLPGYLDGAIDGRDHVRVRAHLESCGECRIHLERYQLLASHLASVEPVPPPAHLAVQIRARASRDSSIWDGVGRWWSRATLVFENILEPLAVPAAGGVLTALAVVVLFVHGMLVGVPMGGVVQNDLPLDLIQPAQLESLAPFPVAGIGATDGQSNSGALLLEATLNAQGQVIFYKILSGPSDAAVRHQIDQVLLFSRFRPQLSFGRPTDGGRVFLSFSEVHVRG
jgi:hypothetical protein